MVGTVFDAVGWHSNHSLSPRPFSRMKTVAKLAPDRTPWTMRELVRLTQMQRALVRCGLRVDCEHGTTDEGDPFTDFCEVGTGKLVVHVARIDRRYVIAWPDGSSVTRTHDLGRAVDLVSKRRHVRASEGLRSREPRR